MHLPGCKYKITFSYDVLVPFCCQSNVVHGLSVVVYRWFETHHQAEAVGSPGGADRQVWVAPRRSWVLRRLPASHAGVGPRKASHRCRMPAPPLARPLVETSCHCTFPPILSRDCNRSLSSTGISNDYLFLLFLFHYFWITYVFVMETMLLCMIVLVLLLV